MKKICQRQEKNYSLITIYYMKPRGNGGDKIREGNGNA
jgi:hypothetical protein